MQGRYAAAVCRDSRYTWKFSIRSTPNTRRGIPSCRVCIASPTRRIITRKHLLPASGASGNHDDGTSFSTNAMTVSFFSNERRRYVAVAGIPSEIHGIGGARFRRIERSRRSMMNVVPAWFRDYLQITTCTRERGS